MDASPTAVMCRISARNPRASEERIAALTVLFYELMMGRPTRPAVPVGMPFTDEPIDAWLRDLKEVAGPEYAIAKDLLVHVPASC